MFAVPEQRGRCVGVESGVEDVVGVCGNGDRDGAGDGGGGGGCGGGPCEESFGESEGAGAVDGEHGDEECGVGTIASVEESCVVERRESIGLIGR